MKRTPPPILAIVLAMPLEAAVAVSREAAVNDLGIDRTARPLPVDGFDDVTAGVFRHGLPLDEALARGEAVAISPPPLQGLLGRDLTYRYDG